MPGAGAGAWGVPVEDHAHGGSGFGGDKGFPEDPGKDSGEGPVQAVGSGPAQHLHIPLGPACVIVKGLQPGHNHTCVCSETICNRAVAETQLMPRC